MWKRAWWIGSRRIGVLLRRDSGPRVVAGRHAWHFRPGRDGLKFGSERGMGSRARPNCGTIPTSAYSRDHDCRGRGLSGHRDRGGFVVQLHRFSRHRGEVERRVSAASVHLSGHTHDDRILAEWTVSSDARDLRTAVHDDHDIQLADRDLVPGLSIAMPRSRSPLTNVPFVLPRSRSRMEDGIQRKDAMMPADHLAVGPQIGNRAPGRSGTSGGDGDQRAA